MASDEELADLERELIQAADIWLNAQLHRKLQRLIEIARLGQRAMAELAELRHESADEGAHS